MSREGTPLLIIQRQLLGHADRRIGLLRGIDSAEIIYAVHERPTHMVPAATSVLISAT